MNTPASPYSYPSSAPQNLSIIFSLLSQSGRREDPSTRSLFAAFESICAIAGGKKREMSRLVCQQKALVGGCVTDGVVCPKPRRVGGVPLHFHDSVRTHSWLLQIKNSPTDVYDAKAGTVLLDIIQSKGSSGSERSNFQVASSPPFFTGSPPSRASNPVILDEQFRNDDANPLSPALLSGGCAQGSCDSKPAPVRIEGFNCRESCSISAVA